MNFKYIASAVGVLAALNCGAQQLSKEIVIDREVEPEIRSITRPELTAGLYVTPVKVMTLKPWEYNRVGEIYPQLTLLEPTAYADTIAVSPYRGYARLGYLPMFNIGASAGYRFVNTANTKVGAWLNYAGSSYHVNTADFLQPDVFTKDKVSLASNTFDVGVDVAHSSTKGNIIADAQFTYASVAQPMYADNFTQNVSGVALSGEWVASTKVLPWHLGAKFSTFGFGKETPGLEEFPCLDPRSSFTPTAVREYIYNVNGGAMKPFGSSAVGLDIDLTFQHLNSLNSFWVLYNPQEETFVDGIENLGDNNFNVLKFAPYYKYTGKSFKARLGIDVNRLTGWNSTTRIAPDIKLAWTPSQQFAVWAVADAPTHVTAVRELYNVSQYMASQFALSPTLVNCDIRAGITIGPVRNVAISGWVGYSNSDYAPVMTATRQYSSFMAQQDGALAFGARVEWCHRVVDVYAGVEGAQNGNDKVYYRWADKAKFDVKAGFTLHPLSKLDIGLDWHFRSGRHFYDVNLSEYLQGDKDDISSSSLGIMNNLSLNGSYHISHQLSVFANIENVMCRRWQIAPGVESARLHGLVGVSYKF